MAELELLVTVTVVQAIEESGFLIVVDGGGVGVGVVTGVSCGMTVYGPNMYSLWPIHCLLYTTLMVVVVLVGLISVNTKFIYPVVVMVWAFASVFSKTPRLRVSKKKKKVTPLAWVGVC